MIKSNLFNQLEETYKNKKVFVTGHTGFKGSWLIKTLNILGAKTMGYSLKPQNKIDLINFIPESKSFTSIIGDIRDLKKLNKKILEFQPDFIFHLAAQPIVRLSYINPIETYETNVIGTLNLLESIKTIVNPCAIIIITTDKVYKNIESNYPYKEDDKLGGYDPYSSSKACSELLVDSYRNSFYNLEKFSQHNKAIAVARAGNIIGGGDWSLDRLVPDIAKSIKDNKTIIIRNPNAVRPWQHVLDALIGYLTLGEKLITSPKTYSKEYNFGPNNDKFFNVKDIMDMILSAWGKGQYIIEKSEHDFHEAQQLILDTNRAHKELNWYPKIDTVKSVFLTVEWYKKFNNNNSLAESITQNQIMEVLNYE